MIQIDDVVDADLEPAIGGEIAGQANEVLPATPDEDVHPVGVGGRQLDRAGAAGTDHDRGRRLVADHSLERSHGEELTVMIATAAPDEPHDLDRLRQPPPAAIEIAQISPTAAQALEGGGRRGQQGRVTVDDVGHQRSDPDA